jgi:hypothetical protein
VLRAAILLLIRIGFSSLKIKKVLGLPCPEDFSETAYLGASRKQLN